MGRVGEEGRWARAGLDARRDQSRASPSIASNSAPCRPTHADDPACLFAACLPAPAPSPRPARGRWRAWTCHDSQTDETGLAADAAADGPAAGGGVSPSVCERNWSLCTLYCLLCGYLALSALQLRDSYPLLVQEKRLLQSTRLANRTLFRAFLATPFLFEVQALLDWTVMPTALDLTQWLLFEVRARAGGRARRPRRVARAAALRRTSRARLSRARRPLSSDRCPPPRPRAAALRASRRTCTRRST